MKKSKKSKTPTKKGKKSKTPKKGKKSGKSTKKKKILKKKKTSVASITKLNEGEFEAGIPKMKTIMLPTLALSKEFDTNSKKNIINHYHHQQVVRTDSHNVEEQMLKAMTQKREQDKQDFQKLSDKIDGFTNIMEKFQQKYKNMVDEKKVTPLTNISSIEESEGNKNVLSKTSLEKKENKEEDLAKKDVNNSYVGGRHSSKLNEMISEIGDSKDMFIKRGTLVVNGSSPEYNRMISQSIKKVNDQMILEEDHEGHTIEGANASNNAQKDNPHNLDEKNPFNNMNLQNNYENSFKKVELFDKNIKQSEMSEDVKPTPEEEKKLEEEIIQKNFKKPVGCGKKGRNFSETFKNIYKDLNKTLDQIEMENQNSSKKISKRRFFFEENEQIAPLKKTKSAKELEEGKKEFLSKVEVKLEDLTKQTKKEEELKGMKRFQSDIAFDFKVDPLKKGGKVVRVIQRNQKNSKN